MNKLLNFSIKEIIILTVIQIFVIRFIAVPVVKKAISDTFKKSDIMCVYDESKNSAKE